MVAALVVGALVAAALSSTLGLRVEDADVPREPPLAVPAAADVTQHATPRIEAIEAPDLPRVQVAVEDLQDASSGAEPAGPATVVSVVVADPGSPDQSYRWSREADRRVVRADGPEGAALALHDLAGRIRTGRQPWPEGTGPVEPDLGLRMLDLGAVGVAQDEQAWRDGTDYSHVSRAFEDVILPGPPFVDAAALSVAREQLLRFVRHGLAGGYNAMAVPGFLEYVTFSGTDVPDAGDHAARARAMRETFGELWREVDSLGMDVYLRTDMLALSSPLADHLERLNGTDTEDPRLWDVYAAAFDEVYTAMPYLAGTIVRIGEAGRIYDLPGWDYFSALEVTTVAGVRAMLEGLLAPAERHGRDLVFRTWSVGVGAVGDMHTVQDSYRSVLDGIDSDRLVVSTKYALGDFYSHLPLNDTLAIGDHRRIVEFQSRREFEAFGALPNALGSLHQVALQVATRANPNVEGVWVWTQDGGPWRAGPMTLYLERGLWQLYELNTQVTAALARDVDADVSTLTEDWVRRHVSREPSTVAAVMAAMSRSREVVTTGLYVGPYAEHRVFALGLEPPPMMWLFEWDILTGDSAVLSVMHAVVGDDLDRALTEGADAIRAAREMLRLVEGASADTWLDAATRQRFVATLRHQVDLMKVLADYRATILWHGEWLSGGGAEARSAWREAAQDYRRGRDAYLAAWTGDLDLPPLNVVPADLGLQRAERDAAMAWAARGLAAATLALLVLGTVLVRRGALAGRRGTIVIGLAAAVPLVLSRLVQTWFLAPAHVAVSLAGWALFVGMLWILTRGTDRRSWVLVLAGFVLARVLLLCAALAPHGPGGYWYTFWTRPTARSAYVVVAVALTVLMLAFVARACRRPGAVAVAAGTAVAVPAAGVALIGLESALTVWNDQLALLPWGLARILGITEHLGIPTALPHVVALAGVVVAVLGAAIPALLTRRTRTTSAVG